MYTTRLPKIGAELAVRLDMISRTAAAMVAETAKSRVPVDTGALRDAIHVERDSTGDYEVVAGNNKVFYGHIVEHGGAHHAARPFLIPAAEELRGELPALINTVMRDL